MAVDAKELETRVVFQKSMETFLHDQSGNIDILGLANEFLGRRDIVVGTASRGLDPRAHAFNPEALDTYMDGAFGFGIYIAPYTNPGDIPAVMYTFDHLEKQGSLDILQMQGVQSYPKLPFKGRWERFGVHLTEMFGEWRGDISKIMIRPVAENNWYANWPIDSSHYQLGLQRYDRTAIRSGYHFNPQFRRFIQNLP